MTARLRLRDLHGPDRMRAALEARVYGFAREITLEEILYGHWFRWGAHGIFWLYSDRNCQPNECALHVAAPHGGRLHERAEEWQAALLVVADLVGCDRVLANPLEPASVVLDPILARLGWTREGEGWYLSAVKGPSWGRPARADRSGAERSRRQSARSGRVRPS
jgi:hypothetical protein